MYIYVPYSDILVWYRTAVRSTGIHVRTIRMYTRILLLYSTYSYYVRTVDAYFNILYVCTVPVRAPTSTGGRGTYHYFATEDEFATAENSDSLIN